MAEYTQKDNSGTIFANDRKEKETQPDGKGKACIGGVLYWVSSWNKTTKDGKPYRSLSFTPVDESKSGGGYARQGQQPARTNAAPQRPAPASPISREPQFSEEDIPF